MRTLAKRVRHYEPTQVLYRNTAYARGDPRVSVLCLIARDDRGEFVEALDSAVASRGTQIELVLAAAPGLAQSATGFLKAHGDVPSILLQRAGLTGTGASFNLLAEHARGEFLFVLDASGRIFPSTLARLITALEVAPAALFSYPMVGVFKHGNPIELRGSLPWEPARLARASWIDPMALLRRKALLSIGGFTTDPELAGNEAPELWRRCAIAGFDGVHLPQVLAWRDCSTKAHEINAEKTTAAGRTAIPPG